jgi:hypothetical protein
MDKDTKLILLSPVEVRELEAMVLAMERIAKGICDILASRQESEKETRLWPAISKYGQNRDACS